MMDIRIINKSEIDQWEYYVDNNPTIAWQTYYWSEIVNRHYDAEFIPIAAFNNEKICGIMPLYLVKNMKRKSLLISVPFAVGGGISSDSMDIEKALIKKAINLYDEKKADRIILKQYKHKLTGPFNTDDNFYNRELDLTVGPEELYNNLDDINKRYIDQSNQVETHLDFPSYDIDAFYKILVLHQRNHGVPCVGKGWIEDLVGYKMYNIAFLKDKEHIVSATLVKEHKRTVSFPFTAIPNISERSNMFAYKLYWELIKKFSAEGKEIFHSGRIPYNDNTNAYRLGWRGQKQKYYYQYYPSSSQSSEFKQKRGRKREILSYLWKKMPLKLSAIIGPKIVRYFP